MAFSRSSVAFLALLCLPACGLIDKRADAGADADVDAAVAVEAADAAAAAADAAVVVSTTPAPGVADCTVLEKTFMDTCQDTCAAKLKENNFKKTDAERRLFCEGGCTSQMFNSPTMAKCKGK